MTAITDFSTDVAKVRLLIGDINAATPIFNDEAIQTFLSLSAESVKRAAAAALLVMATNEVMVQKRIRLLDLSTDGPAEAEALRKLAEQYRKEADIEAAGGIGWLELPSGVGQFDKRTPQSWADLLGER